MKARVLVSLVVVLVLLIIVLVFVPWWSVLRCILDRHQYGSPSVAAIARHEARSFRAVHAFDAHLRRLEAYRHLTWPRLDNFVSEWRRVGDNTFDRIASHRATPHAVVYVHGGGLVAGSPFKRNSFNWITHVTHFAPVHRLVLVSYRLAPEHRAPAALQDVLDAVSRQSRTHTVSLIGFSAGCMLVVQACVALWRWSYEPTSTVFGLPGRSDASRVYAALRDAFLVSGVYRTGSLYLNDTDDISHLITDYFRLVSPDPHRDDPLLHLVHVTRDHPLPPSRVNFHLYDVTRNSLANHSVQLAYALRRGGQSVHLTLYTPREFDLRDFAFTAVARRDAKYLSRDRSRVRSIHYHFFPYIVATEAGAACARSIVANLAAADPNRASLALAANVS